MMPQAQTGKTEASESTEDDENVVLYVSSDSSDRTMTFKIRASQSLDTLMRVFCQRQGLEMASTRFRWNGTALSPSDSPRHLCMKDEAFISVAFEEEVDESSEESSFASVPSNDFLAPGTVEKAIESVGDGGNLNEKHTGSQELKMNNNECPDAVDPQEDKKEHPVRNEREPLPLLGVVAAQIQQSQEDSCGQLSPLEQENITSKIKHRIFTSASAAIVAPLPGQKVVTASLQDDPSASRNSLDMARRDSAACATPTTGTGSVGQGETRMPERDKDTDFHPAELHDEDTGTPEAEEVLRQADSSALCLPPPDQAGSLVAKDLPATKEKQNKDEQDTDRRDAAAGATPTTGTGSVGQEGVSTSEAEELLAPKTAGGNSGDDKEKQNKDEEDMDRHDSAAGATPTTGTGSVEPYDGTYECLFCGESVRGQPGLKCCQCNSNPFHRACDPQSKYAEVCPTCGRKTVEEWTGQGETRMLERDNDTDSHPAELQDEDMGTPEETAGGDSGDDQDEDRDSNAIEKQQQTTTMEREFWECATCTLHNELSDNFCAACSSPGPRNGLRPVKRARCGALESSGYITRQNTSDYSRLSTIRKGELSSSHDKQLAEPWSAAGKHIGRLLAKSFDSKMYLGQVVATSTAKKSQMRLFKVLFQDNDEAVLEEDEVQACFNKLTSRLVAKRNLESLQKYVAAWSHTYVRSFTKAGPGGFSSRLEAHQLRQQFEAGMSRSIDLMQLGCERASTPELRELERLFVECTAGETDSPPGARKRVRERITQALDSDDDEYPPSNNDSSCSSPPPPQHSATVGRKIDANLSMYQEEVEEDGEEMEEDVGGNENDGDAPALGQGKVTGVEAGEDDMDKSMLAKAPEGASVGLGVESPCPCSSGLRFKECHAKFNWSLADFKAFITQGAHVRAGYTKAHGGGVVRGRIAGSGAGTQKRARIEGYAPIDSDVMTNRDAVVRCALERLIVLAQTETDKELGRLALDQLEAVLAGKVTDKVPKDKEVDHNGSNADRREAEIALHTDDKSDEMCPCGNGKKFSACHGKYGWTFEAFKSFWESEQGSSGTKKGKTAPQAEDKNDGDAEAMKEAKKAARNEKARQRRALKKQQEKEQLQQNASDGEENVAEDEEADTNTQDAGAELDGAGSSVGDEMCPCGNGKKFSACHGKYGWTFEAFKSFWESEQGSSGTKKGKTTPQAEDKNDGDAEAMKEAKKAARNEKARQRRALKKQQEKEQLQQNASDGEENVAEDEEADTNTQDAGAELDGAGSSVGDEMCPCGNGKKFSACHGKYGWTFEAFKSFWESEQGSSGTKKGKTAPQAEDKNDGDAEAMKEAKKAARNEKARQRRALKKQQEKEQLQQNASDGEENVAEDEEADTNTQDAGAELDGAGSSVGDEMCPCGNGKKFSACHGKYGWTFEAFKSFWESEQGSPGTKKGKTTPQAEDKNDGDAEAMKEAKKAARNEKARQRRALKKQQEKEQDPFVFDGGEADTNTQDAGAELDGAGSSVGDEMCPCGIGKKFSPCHGKYGWTFEAFKSFWASEMGSG